MRLPVREQLAALILLAALIGVGVISIATWVSWLDTICPVYPLTRQVTVHDFVLRLRGQRMGFIASLKASQLASDLVILQHSGQCISSRVLIGRSLDTYNQQGANSASDWADAAADLQAALDSSVPDDGRLVLQSMVFGLNASGPGGPYGLVNVTLAEVVGQIKLPFSAPNGSDVFLGDPGFGYPASLYPNFTFSTVESGGRTVNRASYDGKTLDSASSALVLGPYRVNDTLALLSMTVPVHRTGPTKEIMGWITVVFDATLITDFLTSPAGLDYTAITTLVGPTNATNQFAPGILYNAGPQVQATIDAQEARYVFPVQANYSDRHPDRVVGSANPPYMLSSFKTVLDVFTKDYHAINNAHGDVYASNEAGVKIATGAATVPFPFVDWAIVVEEARSQVWKPIYELRRVMIACVCATIAGLVVIAWPLAHFVSAPIRHLRSATMKSVMPPGYSDCGESNDDADSELDHESTNDAIDPDLARKEGFLGIVMPWKKKTVRSSSDRREDARRRQFRIPGKVPTRKHLIKDELTDLTSVYNEMSDELMMQYERLEDRVQQRTAELELSKKAAEAANESKTLFIANISHELKTPLNGILGMCAVCMQEDDPVRLKRSLGIIYKSGDLLLNLLTDLLTFSKNQAGQQLSLDEKEFRLRDISTQILAVFDKQASEGQIALSFHFEDKSVDSVDETAQVVPADRMKDMMFWGDTHRILQVVINLVSNSLKFTPPGGKVMVTVRCLGEAPEIVTRRGSEVSKQSRKVSSRKRNSDTSLYKDSSDAGTEKIGSLVRVQEIERVSPPPAGKNLQFEFVVEDTGPGIPEDLHDRIFEPFVQGDLGLTKKYGGTGLGLSICSQLAGLMRGKMGIQSEVGKGSIFSMTIPLRHIFTRASSNASSSTDLRGAAESTPIMGSADPLKAAGPEDRPRLVGLSHPFFAANEPMESPGSQPAAIEAITASATSSGRIRVLVAEDNKVNQEVVLRMLKLEDIYDVTVAKDGQEALDLVKESMKPTSTTGSYNLIFMDVQMPNLDGLQSTRLIREQGYDAPIVALTAFAEESNVKDCLDSGMNHFLSKPIKRPALKKVLNQYCPPILEMDEPTPTSGKSFADGNTSPKTPAAAMPMPPRPSTAPRASLDSADRAADRRPSFADLAGASRPNSTVVVVSRPNSLDGPM